MTPEEQIDEITEAVLEEAGREIVEATKELVSTPYPPSSKGGEPPHLRSGYLQEQISYQVDVIEPVISLTIISAAPYSIFLDGDSIPEKMKGRRPFMSTIADEWTPYVIQRLSAAFAAP